MGLRDGPGGSAGLALAALAGTSQLPPSSFRLLPAFSGERKGLSLAWGHDVNVLPRVPMVRKGAPAIPLHGTQVILAELSSIRKEELSDRVIPSRTPSQKQK